MSNSPQSPRPRKWRRLRWASAIVLVVVVAGIVALPWLVGTPVVRRVVVAQVNRMYAPTVIELEDVDVSWTGPVRLEGVVLKDGNGKAVVSSPTATLDRSLWQLLTMRPDYGTLSLHGAYVDIERRLDGSIDLAEALAPILEGDDEDDDGPPTRFTLAIDGGTLLLASPELASPVTAERLDMTLHCSPSPLRWEIALANPGSQAFDVSGHYDSSDPDAAEVVVAIVGTKWPLAVSQAGVVAEGTFDGTVGVRMVGDSLASTGEATMTGVSAGGPALKGDRPGFDRVEAAWDVAMGADGLAIRRLDLDAPVATVGLSPEAPEGVTRWVGHVDLAALAKQLPNTLALRDGLVLERGTAAVEATVGPVVGDDTAAVVVTARLADLAARNGDQAVTMDEPVTLSARIRQGAGSAVAIESASVESAFLKAEGKGDLDEGVTLSGTIDLDALDGQVRNWVDLGEVALSGSGRFGGDYSRGEDGETFTTRLAIEGRGLRIAGLTDEPIARDAARLDLIVQGPAAPPGLPTGWSRVHVEAKSEGLDAVVDVAPVKDTLSLRGQLALPGAAPTDGQPAPEPTALAFDAAYRSADDRLDLASLEVQHALGLVRAAGRIEGVSAARVADLTGSLEPNWDAISAMLAEATEPNARLAGTPRPFRLSGPLSGGSTNAILQGIDAELGVDLTGAVVFGLEVGPTPVLVRCARGDIQISPIDTTLSGGRVVLTPDVVLGDQGVILLTVGEGSGIEGVEITDEVSRRVLAYIAPVLREATQVDGRVSARFARLAVPLTGPPSGQGGPSTDLAAKVAFQQVTYGPGPMMQNILGMSGMSAQQVPHLTINQVVDVTIADGRVHQSGLEIVAAEGVAMRLEGSVGLDQTLAMRVGVPLSDRMLGGQEVLSDVLGGTRVGLPIVGTLGQPQLDREAFRVGLRQQGGRLLGRGAAVGAGQLLRLLDEEEGAPSTDAETDGPSRVAPPAEEMLRGLGRGLLRDVIGGEPGQPEGDGGP